MNLNSNSEFEKWYKQTIEEHREEPPQCVWDNLENELDINNVWLRLDTCLSEKATKPNVSLFPKLTRWVAAAAVVALVMWTNTLSETVLRVNVSQSQSASVVTSEHKASDTKLAATSRRVATVALAQTEPKDLAQTDEIDFTSQKIPTTHSEGGIAQLKEKLAALGKKMSQPKEQLAMTEVNGDLFAHTWARGLAYLAPIDECKLGDAYFDNRPFQKRVKIGVIGALTNTWALTRNQYVAGGNADYSIVSLGGAGKNFGLLASVDLDRNLSLQVEMMRIETSQRIQSTFAESFTPFNLNLKYMTLGVLGVYRSPHSLEGIDASWNIAAGLTIARLLSAQEENTRGKVDVAPRYTERIANVSFGVEYEISPLQDWTAVIGVRSNYALNSIEREPAEQSVTRSNIFFWGAHLTLKYRIF